jgi:hypothetical protein
MPEGEKHLPLLKNIAANVNLIKLFFVIVFGIIFFFMPKM